MKVGNSKVNCVESSMSYHEIHRHLGILPGEDAVVQEMKYKKNILHKCPRYSPQSGIVG